MSVLAIQRCLHHPSREAVARCAECGNPFCRECIAEHDQRIICATCLQRLLKPVEVKRRPWGLMVRQTAGSLGGFMLAWLCFYCLGRMLLMLPSSFHVAVWGEPSEISTEDRKP